MNVAKRIAGPNFRGLTSIRQKDSAAVFEATIPDTRSSMPCNCESDYLVHPATLDACLQVMLVTVPKTDDVPKQIWIPTAIGTIQISNDIHIIIIVKFFTASVSLRATDFESLLVLL